MFKINSVTHVFKISKLQSVREYCRMLQSVTEYYEVLQSVTECYRVLQSISSAFTCTKFWACFYTGKILENKIYTEKCQFFALNL